MANLDKIRENVKIKTNAVLDNTTGMLIKQVYLDARKPNTIGTIRGYVAGHGGDVWWVQHDGSDEIAAYCFTEFETLE